MSLDERSDELDRKMAEHPAEEAIRVLVKDADRRKRQLHILTISVILDIVLSISLAAVTYKTNELVHLAQSNKTAVIQNCETANDSRKNQLALWNYVFSVTPTQPRTPEQEHRTDDFRAFVAKTFAQRDCQNEINQ